LNIALHIFSVHWNLEGRVTHEFKHPVVATDEEAAMEQAKLFYGHIQPPSPAHHLGVEKTGKFLLITT
jgi:hypothetical protein